MLYLSREILNHIRLGVLVGTVVFAKENSKLSSWLTPREIHMPKNGCSVEPRRGKIINMTTTFQWEVLYLMENKDARLYAG